MKFILCATAAEGEPGGAAARKTWGLFSRTRGLFAESGEEKAKIRGLFASALAEGRAALGKWREEEARWRGAVGWGATRGDERERRRGREWAHRGRKGAQGAAVQEIMRIFVAD